MQQLLRDTSPSGWEFSLDNDSAAYHGPNLRPTGALPVPESGTLFFSVVHSPPECTAQKNGVSGSGLGRPPVALRVAPVDPAVPAPAAPVANPQAQAQNMAQPWDLPGMEHWGRDTSGRDVTANWLSGGIEVLRIRGEAILIPRALALQYVAFQQLFQEPSPPGGYSFSGGCAQLRDQRP
jgi:hypothetical protein